MGGRLHSLRRAVVAVGALSLIGSTLVAFGTIGTSPAQAAGGCSDSWTNTAGGSWETPTNWSDGAVPTISDTVCITAPGTYTVTVSGGMSGTETVGGLTLGAGSGTQTLDIAGTATLRAYGTTTNGLGSTIDNQGSFIVSPLSSFDQDSGTTTGNPISLSESTLNITGTSASSFDALAGYGPDVTGSVAADQSLTINSGSSLNFTGPLTNAGSITWTGAGSGSDITVSGGTLTNTGTIQADASTTGQLLVDASIDNQASGKIIGNSSITYNSGNLTNEGSISVASGTTFEGYGTLQNVSGSIDNQGTFLVAPLATFDEESGTTTGNPISLSESNLDLEGSGSSSFDAYAGYAPGITGNIASDQSITINAGSALDFTGPLTNAGAIIWTGAGSGSTISVAGGTLTNSGSITADASTTGSLVLSGTFDNAGGGTITGDSSITYEDGTLTNAGMLTVGGGTTFTNGGTVDNTTGTINDNGTLQGDYDVTFGEGSGPINGNSVILSGDNLNLTGSGAASFTVNAGYSVTVTGPLASDQTLIVQSGSGVYGLATSNGTIDSEPGAGGATFANSLVNNGTLSLGLGTTTLTGTFTQGAGGTFATTVDGSQVGKLSLNGAASLAGALDVSTTAVPTEGSILPIVSAPSRSGTFTTVTGQNAGGGLTYSVGYTSPGVVLYAGVPGGAITLKKSTRLFGHYSDKISGSGWGAHGDTSVTINQCATPFYTATTCDTANQVHENLGTGAKAGTFKNAVIKLAVGTIDTDGDTCGTERDVAVLHRRGGELRRLHQQWRPRIHPPQRDGQEDRRGGRRLRRQGDGGGLPGWGHRDGAGV